MQCSATCKYNILCRLEAAVVDTIETPQYLFLRISQLYYDSAACQSLSRTRYIRTSLNTQRHFLKFPNKIRIGKFTTYYVLHANLLCDCAHCSPINQKKVIKGQEEKKCI